MRVQIPIKINSFILTPIGTFGLIILTFLIFIYINFLYFLNLNYSSYSLIFKIIAISDLIISLKNYRQIL